MTRVGIAELKAHLSKHLRAVKKGEQVIVLDHEKPVAVISPYQEAPRLTARPPRRPLHSTKLPTKPLGTGDAVADLVEDRRKDRG